MKFTTLLYLSFTVYYHVNAGKADDKCKQYFPKVDQNNTPPNKPYPVYTEQRSADEKEFPHTVHLGTKIDEKLVFFCGGALISDEYVLTLASCIERHPPTDIRLGTTKANSDTKEPNSQYHSVETVTKHPDYSKDNQNNDIALIKLKDKVQFSDYVQPACLQTSEEIREENAVASDWKSFVGTSDNLVRMTMNIQNKDDCKEQFEKENINFNNIICVRRRSGTRGSCKSDGGGPVQIYKQRDPNVYSIIGIVPLGTALCTKEIPTEFITKVSHFVPWIENIVWQ